MDDVHWMKEIPMHIRAMTWMALSILASSGVGWAQAGGGYDLSWSSLDCGSPTTSSGGAYRVGGTIGQADGGKLTGGPYTMQGGFRQESVTPTDAPPQDSPEASALVFRLHGNTPNPFTSSTAIAFSSARESHVELRIYDLGGRLVRTLLARQLGAGRHQANWDGNDDAGQAVARGVYFMRLRAGSFEARKKIVLLR
jgi:hypothetical protein